MAERQLNHFTDLSHLLPATTNVVIADLVEVVLLLIALDRLTLAVDDGVLSNYAVLRRVDLDDFEFYLPHATAHDEEVTLPNGPVGFPEVWGEENIEERPGEALDGIGDRKDRDPLGLFLLSDLWEPGSLLQRDSTHIFDIRARVDGDDIAVLDPQVVADNPVDAGTAVIEVIVGQDDQHGVLPLLAADQHCVTTEQLEGIHGVI
jgi:hypothetical protein